MHPRNRFQSRYDFPRLIAGIPDLARYLRPNPAGDMSIDFADPAAVTALNRALLKDAYGISYWDVPPGYLCPPIPGRTDYIQHVADLLATSHGGSVPGGKTVVVLDIGVGANCIYPIIGVSEYGWRFVGSEIDPAALQSARTIVAKNPSLSGRIECRQQTSSASIFHGIVRPGEAFDLTVCNPPFHASAAEAAQGTRRKLRNLSGARAAAAPVLNFGGQARELWCRGGEAAFVRRMIAESATLPDTCLWYTTLVSKSDSLPAIYRALDQAGVADSRTIAMQLGQKQSRIVAWTFIALPEHPVWRRKRNSRNAIAQKRIAPPA